MKKYMIGLLFSILLLGGFSLAKADTNSSVNAITGSSALTSTPPTTCAANPEATTESKIQKRVDAAKIDYSLDPDGFREKLIKEAVDTFGVEYLDKIGYFVYTILPDGIEKVRDQVEVVTVKDSTGEVTLNGSYIMTDKVLFKKFGNYFFDAKTKNPQLVGLIQQVKSSFKPEDLGVAFPNKNIQLYDGRTIALFSGCTAHNCAGTENMVVYDFANEKAFLLQENSDSTKIYIYGNPDKEIRNILLYEYLYH